MNYSAEQTVAAIKDAERYANETEPGVHAPWWAAKKGSIVPAHRLFDHELNPIGAARVSAAHEAMRARIANGEALFIYPLAEDQGGATIGWEDQSGAIHVGFASDLRVTDERLPIYPMLERLGTHEQKMEYPGDIVMRNERPHLRLSNLLNEEPAGTPGAELARRLSTGTNTIGQCDFGGENPALRLKGDRPNKVPCGTETLMIVADRGMFKIGMEICEMCYAAALNVVAEGMQDAILAAQAKAFAQIGSWPVLVNGADND